MDTLPITTINVIPNLSYPPNGTMMILFVNGIAFFPIGPQASFTISGQYINVDKYNVLDPSGGSGHRCIYACLSFFWLFSLRNY